MNSMMYDLALTGITFGLGAGASAAFLGYMLNKAFGLLNKFIQ